MSPFGVPGDALLDDGALAPGPHHQEPPCRHFPECGGCQLQHADDEAYRGYLVVAGRGGAGPARARDRNPRAASVAAADAAAGDFAGAEGRAGRRRRLQRRRSRTRSSTCANAISCGPSCSRWSRRCGLLAGLLPAEADRRSPADPGRPGRRRAAQGRSTSKGLQAIERLTAFAMRARAGAAEHRPGTGARDAL